MSKLLKLDLAAILAKHTDADPAIRSDISSLIKKCDVIAKQHDCPHTSTKVVRGSCFYGEYETTFCKICDKELKHEKNW